MPRSCSQDRRNDIDNDDNGVGGCGDDDDNGDYDADDDDEGC